MPGPLRIEGLVRWREIAAQASGGISGDAIHAALERELRLQHAAGRVLDFGAGTGQLARKLLHWPEVRALECVDLLPRPAALPDAIGWSVADLNEPIAFADASFDVVVSAEVIEHLENPRAVAREWHRLLRPGGLLVFSTPNNESWRALLALLIRGHFVYFNDASYPAHITALVRKDIERILLEAGFSPPRLSYTDAGGLPKAPNITWQRLSCGLLKGLRYSDNLVACARTSA
jgi:2-polyprenyl-3-methyl-5-hydroxy-6-metoxy-1,4-benzoquinol methylase